MTIVYLGTKEQLEQDANEVQEILANARTKGRSLHYVKGDKIGYHTATTVLSNWATQYGIEKQYEEHNQMLDQLAKLRSHIQLFDFTDNEDPVFDLSKIVCKDPMASIDRRKFYEAKDELTKYIRKTWAILRADPHIPRSDYPETLKRNCTTWFADKYGAAGYGLLLEFRFNDPKLSEISRTTADVKMSNGKYLEDFVLTL